MGNENNRSIDITPTWEDALVFFNTFLNSSNIKGLTGLHESIVTAMSCAHALNELMPSLTEEQQKVIDKSEERFLELKNHSLY